MTILDKWIPKKEVNTTSKKTAPKSSCSLKETDKQEEEEDKPIFKHKPSVDCIFLPIAFVDFSCLDECEDVDYCPIIIKLEELAYNLKRKGQNLFRLIRQQDEDIALWLYWRALQLKCPKIWRRYKKQTQ